MPNNPLFRPTNSPTNTTKPTKAVNQTGTKVRLTHNTFDNSYFNFKTQRYGQYEPFFWKPVIPGDNEPFSNSHNVRSLPFASPILSPMKLNKDYFLVPRYAIQPNAWDYIFKTPTQGDDVPITAQNIMPLFNLNDTGDISTSFRDWVYNFVIAWNTFVESAEVGEPIPIAQLPFFLLVFENFLSSGSLLYNMGYKLNQAFILNRDEDSERAVSFDYLFDLFFNSVDLTFSLDLPDPDAVGGFRVSQFSTRRVAGESDSISPVFQYIDKFTALSLLRNNLSYVSVLTVYPIVEPSTLGQVVLPTSQGFRLDSDSDSASSEPVNFLRLDNIIAYQLACSQYYVNPRVDFLYNAQLYRDNFIQQLRSVCNDLLGVRLDLNYFDMNGLPVLYDFFSLYYFRYFAFCFESFAGGAGNDSLSFLDFDDFHAKRDFAALVNYIFGYREQLRFGNYLTDSRTQALGYGQPGSDVVQVMDDTVSVTDLTQKLVLERYRGAVAHLDGTSEDYLATMFHEQLPPDYHYPKFIAHSEFAINGEEISNTTSDNQGNIVTNLKSGDDTAEFNIEISVPSIIVGISYVSIPELYCQVKERSYFHMDRFDEFQTLLQYLGDQEIYNREVSDDLPNPSDAYGYVSRNGEYKQRLSQVSGGFVEILRSWIFTVDLPPFVTDVDSVTLSTTQSPVAIRAHDFEFNRFLARQTGLSLGRGFHFIMQYNNKNVDNRPMDVNPLPLYPSNNL